MPPLLVLLLCHWGQLQQQHHHLEPEALNLLLLIWECLLPACLMVLEDMELTCTSPSLSMLMVQCSQALAHQATVTLLLLLFGAQSLLLTCEDLSCRTLTFLPLELPREALSTPRRHLLRESASMALVDSAPLQRSPSSGRFLPRLRLLLRPNRNTTFISTASFCMCLTRPLRHTRPPTLAVVLPIR